MKALALILAATAAHADPVTLWGDSSASLGPCPQADACLTVTNTLTHSEDEFDRVLSLDGMTVRLHVSIGAGSLPDTITVTPPVGFTVNPPRAMIEEGHSAVFQIFAPLIG